MKAAQARKNTVASQKRIIEEKINKAADEGSFGITVNFPIEEQTTKELQKMGFAMEASAIISGTTHICWV